MMVKGWKASKLVVMDPFARSPGFKYGSSSVRSQEQRYIKLRSKLSGFKNAEVLRSGTEALDGYPRRYFDFVYLDYTHDFTKLAKVRTDFTWVTLWFMNYKNNLHRLVVWKYAALHQ